MRYFYDEIVKMFGSYMNLLILNLFVIKYLKLCATDDECIFYQQI